jgi:hypothetical protein
MKENWMIILQEIVNLIQEYQNKAAADKIKIEQYEKSVREQYHKLVRRRELDGFLRFLYHDFGNEYNLYPLLFSILFKSTRDERCLQEVLKFLSEGKIDVFNSINIRRQIEVGIFTNSHIGQNYEHRRKVHKMQLNQMTEQLEVRYPYVPWEDRNENLVIVVTNQLLYDQHAPSRNVKDICSALMDMGKEVLLIVAVDKENDNDLEQSWCNPLFINYIDEYTGKFKLTYYQQDISGYQILLHKNNLQEIRDIIGDIYNLKPQFIWYMGGTSVFADICNTFTTVASMPFASGYTISDASIMIEHTHDISDEHVKTEEYIAKEHQIMMHFDYQQKIRLSNHKYSRKDFNLLEDSFLITVIGNRLDDEITPDFMELLSKLLQISSDIHIVFIGKMKERNDLIDESRMHYLGYQMDMIGVLGIMDPFLNPPRKGGGTGASWSLVHGIPVITLDRCDVASYVDEDFICKDEKEICKMVEKYVFDKTYYQKQSLKAKLLITEYEKKNDITLSIEQLINNMKLSIKQLEMNVC